MQNTHVRALYMTASLLLGLPAAYAQQALTFSNTSVQGQPITVTLLAGSNVSLGATGNWSASCVLSPSSSVCAGLPAGGGTSGGTAPSVNITATSFSQSSNTSGAYPAGTSVLLTPVVSNAEICVRSVVGGTPSTSWSGTVSGPPFGAVTATLSNPSSSYQFSLRCYGPGGATSFTLPAITTQEGTTPPPSGCSAPPAGQPTLVGFSGLSRLAPPSVFPDLIAPQNAQTSRCIDFPSTSGLFCHIQTSRTPNNQYVSLQFTVPENGNFSSLSRRFEWTQSQLVGAATPSSIYVTISRCPGDFRIPVLGAAAPANDPTFAASCTNKASAGSISYSVGEGPSTGTDCVLTPGNTYYFNYVRGRPSGTTELQSRSCLSGTSGCGIQMEIK